MPQEIKHIMDVIPKFIELNKNLVRIREFVQNESTINYESQDARMVALDSLQQSILATCWWIQCYVSLANYHIKDRDFKETYFLQSLGSGIDIHQTEKIMLDFLKFGLIIIPHFQIENLFHNILAHLNAVPEREGHGNLVNTILKECSLPTNGIEKNTLVAFSYLRNSFHGNGIHRKGNFYTTIEGMNFNFIKDTRVECATWEHIIVLLNANVKILEKILQSDRVKNIKTPIKDDFAFGA